MCDNNSREQNSQPRKMNCVLNILLTLCSGFMWHTVGVGGGGGHLYGWPLWEEARSCPVQDTAGSNRPTTEHSWAPQPSWGRLWENMFKKGNTKVREKRRKNSSIAEQISPAACGGPHSGARGYSWRNCSPWRAHTRAEERCEEEGVAERYH